MLDEMGWLKRITTGKASREKSRGIPLTDFPGVPNQQEYIEFDRPQMFVRHQAP